MVSGLKREKAMPFTKRELNFREKIMNSDLLLLTLKCLIPIKKCEVGSSSRDKYETLVINLVSWNLARAILNGFFSQECVKNLIQSQSYRLFQKKFNFMNENYLV